VFANTILIVEFLLAYWNDDNIILRNINHIYTCNFLQILFHNCTIKYVIRKDGFKMKLISEKLTNKNGIEITLLNLGAALIGASVPGPDGVRKELVLGFENNEEYFNDPFHFGSTPGRFAGRIGGSRFTLNGITYDLPPNEGRNQLHGGENGFAKKLWDTERDNEHVTFSYISQDGENGYPGNLSVRIVYSLNDDNELTIEYTATTDADTVLNLTNHAYFNLNGDDGKIFDHTLWIESDAFIITSKENIPTGEIRKTAGSALDFSESKRLGDVIAADEEAITNFKGIDSCFVLKGEGLRKVAVLSDPASGRTLEVITDQPGLQIYSSQWIPENTSGRGGVIYGPFSGVCLEAQHFPDSPNRPEFPSTILRKGEVFKATIIYRFCL